MREIIFDTETTGFEPQSGDRLVEIDCIELVNRVPTGQTFHAYYNPQRPMPAAAEAIHGLSDNFLRDKPLFSEGVEALLDFLGNCPLIAHNAQFDFGFLNHELMRCGRDIIDMLRMVDTIALARTLHPGAKHRLHALCTRYGIDRSHRIKHGALLDAELLAQLYIELTGGRQIGFALATDIPATQAERTTAKPHIRIIRPARAHRASAEELERHAAFIAGLNNPLWMELGPVA